MEQYITNLYFPALNYFGEDTKITVSEFPFHQPHKILITAQCCFWINIDRGTTTNSLLDFYLGFTALKILANHVSLGKTSKGIGDDIYAKAAVAWRCASSIGKGVK